MLTQNLFKNLSWSFFGRLIYVLINLLSSIVLARILGPESIGVVAVIMFFNGICNVLIDSGLSGALIRKHDVAEKDYSTIFIFNLTITMLLAALIILFSQKIEDFYKINELSNFLIVSMVILFLNAFRLTQNIKLIKSMNFKVKSLIELGSILLSTTVAIILAMKDYGIWSVIYSQIAGALFLTLLSWLYVGPIKSFRFDLNSFKGMYKFGINTTIASILDVTFNNIYQIILAKFFSINRAGLFYQAQKLQDANNGLMQSSILMVIYSYLTKYSANKLDFYKKFNEIQRKYLSIIALISLFVFYYSELIIVQLYGQQWLSSAYYLKILMIVSFFYLGENYNRIVFKVYNRTELILKLEILKKILQSISISIGLYFWSIDLLLWSYVLVVFLSYMLNLRSAIEIIGVDFGLENVGLFILFFSIFISVVSFYLMNFFIINEDFHMFFGVFSLILFILLLIIFGFLRLSNSNN
ncbi:lipopolysaccharide biosynthesis protein [Acinetobacter pragensis]|uniref:lipopolysaccharide biosynthesis protein n=1 Tax=Acinetobacter pragensis TaxID=1806892 RepID=UPI00333FE7A8